MDIDFWIKLIVIVVIVAGILPTIVISTGIYIALLVRTSKKKWGRECSLPEDEEYHHMYELGLEWGKQYESYMEDVEITSDGFHLVGQYFDFGSDKVVIIIAGRMEACLYSYYFAEPYRASGYNVLVIDNRSHGLSDGTFCSLGFKEYRDIIEWSKFLNKEKGNVSVILHGICIGSSVALFAITDKACPSVISGMVADGMYTTFCESFKNHLIEQHRPQFPFTLMVMALIRIFSGANAMTDGPIKRISKLKKPILFIHSKEDIYSLPEKAQVLYDMCQSKKEISWFDKGAHSRVRINNPDGYDKAIINFLEENF